MFTFGLVFRLTFTIGSAPHYFMAIAPLDEDRGRWRVIDLEDGYMYPAYEHNLTDIVS